jgi:hypothetical protein
MARRITFFGRLAHGSGRWPATPSSEDVRHLLVQAALVIASFILLALLFALAFGVLNDLAF